MDQIVEHLQIEYLQQSCEKKKAFENLIFNFYLPGKTLMTSRNPDYM